MFQVMKENKKLSSVTNKKRSAYEKVTRCKTNNVFTLWHKILRIEAWKVPYNHLSSTKTRENAFV